MATDTVPSAVDIVAAISSATPVSSVKTDQGISCANGKWLSATFEGTPFILCASANDRDFTAYGEDLSVAFEYLNEEVAISKPSTAPSDCSAVTTNSVALPALGQLYGTTVSGFRRALKEEAAAARLASPTCTCQGTPRPCLFFHGMDATADGGIVDDYAFFGDIKEHAPCCSSFNFAVLNTVDYAWYDDTLQQKACNAAMNVTASSVSNGSTVINDLIVVAHSMGNSMFAGALATGKCSIGKNVDWVALSGPMKGSMGSDFIHKICGSDNDPKYAGLLAGGLLIPHHSSKNDGIVEFQSCVGNLDASKFTDTYSNTWYAAKLNHADTTFHDGEGLFSSARKPLKWFECLL
ncbi:hypothetical protein BBO99_00001612 [Phytophthora kernoviae]|uniref:Uncharacterized protein n=2 Tax=Phytophthora kernoviae TaxID=325452 RepID=A0A3R7JAZ9_9STRA|nr:hypothetical protein G195_002243 [Phytophthora kernoviae 00238/432]KAG2531241.1 hypothetical protein JM16_001206 [Phytophthora kernoviae]KAG2531907.1 hypothetical protein JM18_001529 [Phytophthora kernoviae]RLN45664.1 hypothetical protein BBI17_001382 [Phytophthora kernoviae]RLN84044.1 hypothetical protein BBO99_00001612 [Phytophthora kernoviae]